MSHESDIKVGVVAPMVWTFRFQEAESFMVGDLANGGVSAEMLWYHPTTQFPEVLKNLGGIMVGSVNDQNFEDWRKADVKVDNVVAGWDRVVTNAIHYATEQNKPIFTQIPFENVGYYDFVEGHVISFEEHFGKTERPNWIEGAEYVLIERGALGARTIKERLTS